MPAGSFVIGRSSACHLALDDPLVSRRHATVDVQPDGAWIEDLDSRNGVFVNGDRIAGRRKLCHLDRISIGSHELVLIEVPDRPELALVCNACGAPVAAGTRFCHRCGNPAVEGRPTLAGLTVELPSGPVDPSTTQRIEALRIAEAGDEGTATALLGGIADKALALGRFDEAERVLARSLHELLSRARSGDPLPAHRVREATRYALRLAEGTRRGAWLDYVFDLHTATGRLMSADDIEKIHDTVRRVRYTGAAAVRRYLDAMRARADGLGPAERFLLSRIEGLERVVSA